MSTAAIVVNGADIQQLIDRGTLDGVEVKEDGTRVLNLNTIMIRLAKMSADEPIEKAE